MKVHKKKINAIYISLVTEENVTFPETCSMWPPYRIKLLMDEKYHDFFTNPKFSIVARLLSPVGLIQFFVNQFCPLESNIYSEIQMNVEQ